MSFGYNANSALTNSIATIEDVAGTLLALLMSKRRSEDAKKRPIIFIAHSLGGVVVKQVSTATFTCSTPIYVQSPTPGAGTRE